MCEQIKTGGERPEKCKWWSMNTMDKFNSKFDDLIIGIKDFNALKIDCIHTSYSVDHGQGKFWVISKLLVKLVNGTKCKLIYPLAENICREGNRIFLKILLYRI